MDEGQLFRFGSEGKHFFELGVGLEFEPFGQLKITITTVVCLLLCQLFDVIHQRQGSEQEFACGCITAVNGLVFEYRIGHGGFLE